MDFFSKLLGTALGVIVVLGLIVLIVVLVVRHKLRKSGLGNALSGNDVSRLVRAVSDDLKSGKIQERMEQPRSLNGMDRIYRPLIEQDFPDISVDEFKDHAEVLLVSTLEAIEQQDLNKLYDAGPSYRGQVKHMIEDFKNNGQRLIADNTQIHNSVISMYKKSTSSAEITFQSAVQSRIALLDSNDQIVRGKRDFDSQLRVEQTLIYVIDPALYEDNNKQVLAANCPNCGAPIRYANNTCPYCGTYNNLIPLRNWIFSGFKLT